MSSISEPIQIVFNISNTYRSMSVIIICCINGRFQNYTLYVLYYFFQSIIFIIIVNIKYKYTRPARCKSDNEKRRHFPLRHLNSDFRGYQRFRNSKHQFSKIFKLFLKYWGWIWNDRKIWGGDLCT